MATITIDQNKDHLENTGYLEYLTYHKNVHSRIKKRNKSEKENRNLLSIKKQFLSNRAKQFVPMNYSHRFQEYSTADIVVLDNDKTARSLLTRYLQRLQVTCENEKSTNRRHLVVKTYSTGQELLENIIQNEESYAIVTINNSLGPKSPGGREVVRQLRSGGYKGAIIYIVGSTHYNEKHLLEVGADAILNKGTENLKHEIERLVSDLVIYDKFID